MSDKEIMGKAIYYTDVKCNLQNFFNEDDIEIQRLRFVDGYKQALEDFESGHLKKNKLHRRKILGDFESAEKKDKAMKDLLISLIINVIIVISLVVLFIAFSMLYYTILVADESIILKLGAISLVTVGLLMTILIFLIKPSRRIHRP